MNTITQCKRLFAVVMVLGATGGAWAAPSGAIFTTNSTGQTVDQNIYSLKTDVYLNGGPQNTKSAGLSPDGVYYFQVTEPDGTLLSSDNAECRQLNVVNGVVAGAYTGGSCYHSNGTYNSANGSTPVQLVPFNNTGNPGGEYKAWLIAKTADTSIDPLDPKTIIFKNDDTKTDNFKVLLSPTANYNISGFKFYDANLNGTMDSGELGIPFWKIALFGGALSNTTTVLTDTTGAYLFTNLVAETYGVCEILPTSSPVWIATSPTTINNIIVPPDSVNNNFGNVCLGAGGGLTLGFWSNKNGQLLFGADDLALMVSLNLRNANGSIFDPVDYSSFRTWLLNAKATNMAYMLSAQLAAMELNVLNGKVSGSSMIFAGKAPDNCSVSGLNAKGFISINNLMNAANSSLGSNGYTVASSDIRNCQDFMKNALDDANNDRNFVQPKACAVNYSGTEKVSCQ